MLMICLFLSIWVFWLFVILGWLMGFRSRRAVDGDTVYVTVPVPGWVKNGLVDLALVSEVSFQRLVGLLLVNGLRDAEGLALLEVDKPVEPLGGVLAYLRGERRLEPCGQVSCVKVPVEVLGSSFCDVCGVCLGV
jgi:hypothetical protein